MNINLILAVLWLVLGGAVIYRDWTHPDQAWHIRGTGISAGWLAVVLAVYNLIRWWSLRTGEKNRRALEAMRQQHERARSHRPAGPPPEPDPTFDFGRPSPEEQSDEPPR